MPDRFSAVGQPFEIVSVRRAEPPPGTEGSDWHRYVIVQGSNTIQGHRLGNLEAVTATVEAIVARLNERRSGKRSRVNLAPTPKDNARK